MEKDDHYLEGLDDVGEGDAALEEESTVEAEALTRIDRPAPVAEEEPVEGAPADAAQPLLSLAPDVPVAVTVVMGRKSVSVKDLLELRSGSVVDMEKLPGDPIELLAAGRLIAKGELVTVDGKLGIRILKLLK